MTVDEIERQLGQIQVALEVIRYDKLVYIHGHVDAGPLQDRDLEWCLNEEYVLKLEFDMLQADLAEIRKDLAPPKPLTFQDLINPQRLRRL